MDTHGLHGVKAEYLDFEIQLFNQPENRIRVTVRSPAGYVNELAHSPYEHEGLLQLMTTVESSRSISAKVLKKLGKVLFEAIFIPEVLALYRTSRIMARTQDKGLRLKFLIDDPVLAALPWEYLYDEHEGDHISLSSDTPLVRYLESGQSVSPLTIKPPLRILGMVASPKDLAQLDIENEKDLIEEALKQESESGHVELTWLNGETSHDLQKALLRGPWHVFHFIGHGGFDEELEESYIVLCESNHNKVSSRLTATDLGRLLDGRKSMRVALINACKGAKVAEHSLLSSNGTVLVRRYIPAVISMQYEITDTAAIEFSRAFYETIGAGFAVDFAVQEARKSIQMRVKGTSDWGTPVLHARTLEGCLFRKNDREAVLSALDAPEEKTELPPLPAPGKNTRHDLGILRERVSISWLDGVLNQSLNHSSLIKLGLDAMPTVVDNPWGEIPFSADQSIDTIFEHLGGAMLILGEPGAGKTTLMLTLAQNLLKQFDEDPTRRLPVVFNLSSWAYRADTLANWLVLELSNRYQIPVPVGREWLQSGRILLLLDGLDEVSLDKQAACVEAINAFIHDVKLVSVVVCCRFKEYLSLPGKLKLNGAVRVQLLTKRRVLKHVEEAGPHLDEMRKALEQDSSLLTLAQTPYMLNQMIYIFTHEQSESLESPTYVSIESRKSQVLDAFLKLQYGKAFLRRSNV